MARSGLICFLALTVFNMAMSMPTQRDARFLDFSDPNTQIAGLAGLGVAALAANNLLSGNDRISNHEKYCSAGTLKYCYSLK